MPDKDFFLRDTRQVARDLLGKYLYRRKGNLLYRGIVSETEAYHGMEDLGCHCSKGRTPRTDIMFREGGHIYVYLIYGMYEMLNFTTMPDGFPAAVLIRGVLQPEVSVDGVTFKSLEHKTDGPGKLTKRFEIDRSLNRLPILEETGLWIEEGLTIPDEQILRTPRIGIDYAGEWKHKPWRFVIKKW